MSYQDELQRLVEAKASMRQSIINKGVEVPDDAKIEDYAGYILQIQNGGGGGWDPANPTIDGLKDAISRGEDIEIGIEIPDTYNGVSNPLIVSQKLDSDNNSLYGGAEGYILIRKYVEPLQQAYGASSAAFGYQSSLLKTFLDSTYLNNCSAGIQSAISDISVKYNDTDSVVAKWFALSSTELGFATDSNRYVDGIFLDYWKQKTNLQSGSDSANTGRVITDSSGSAQQVWTRSRTNNGSFTVATVLATGARGSSQATNKYGVLPACFISRGGN